MRRLAALGSLSLSLFACRAHEVQSQKLNDGSWSFTCNLPMEECIRQVEKTCRSQRYRIVEGTSEPRIRDVPPLETTYYTSRLRLMCNHPEKSDSASPPPGSVASPSQSPPSPPPANLCTKGETRECVGAGACKGGQACLPDGAGFGACECGPAPAPSAAPLAEPSAGTPAVAPPAQP